MYHANLKLAALAAISAAILLAAPAAAQDDQNVSTSGSSTGAMTTSTGGTATTSGFCIPGGLGCGPDSDLTPLEPGQSLGDTSSGEATSVPEPSGIALLLLGLGLFWGNRMQRRRKRDAA